MSKIKSLISLLAFIIINACTPKPEQIFYPCDETHDPKAEYCVTNYGNHGIK